MRETAAQRIRRILNATGGYRMTGETSADWETEACGAGAALIDEAVSGLLKDLFPAEAEARLPRWEELFYGQPTPGAQADRQRMTACWLAQNPGISGREALAASLPAAGLVGDLMEMDGGLQVLVGRRLGLTPEGTLRELNELLPAHLFWQVTEEMNWVMMDAWSRPFEEIDARELTWAEIDALTEEALIGLNTDAAPDGEEI